MRSSPVRAGFRLTLLVLLLLACVLPHLLAKALTGRSRWPRRFLAATARLCGAQVRIDGAPLRPHSLIVANHVSWLDIPILAGATGTAFVSKDELRGHPVMRWLADQNDTLYIDRSNRRSTPAQAEAIARALHDPRPLTIFPEGTVGPGDGLLPFRSSLLAAVAPPPREVDVRPVALDYGDSAASVRWQDESGIRNFFRVLGLTRPVRVTIRLLPALDEPGDRKRIAEQARDSIAQALASTHARAPLQPLDR